MIKIKNGYVPVAVAQTIPVASQIDTNIKITSIPGIYPYISDPFDERGIVTVYPTQLETEFENLIETKQNEPLLTDE